MKSMFFALVVSLIAPLSAYAQNVSWELIDSGILNHNLHGRGIEMRIQPKPFPKGLFEDQRLDRLFASLCEHYAPYVVPFVQKKADFQSPEFLAVRIVSGGMFGSYALQAFENDDGGCGRPL